MKATAFLVPALLGSAVLAQEHRLTSARLEGEILHLVADNELQAVRHFPLPGPPRVVVDLFGIERSVAEMPAPPAESPAFEVRTGEHPEFLRVVVDLRSALPSYQVRQSRGVVEVALGTTLPPSTTGVLIGESPAPGPPSAPQPVSAPASDVAVEAGGRPAAVSSVSPAPTGAELRNLDQLTADELLALVDAQLAAAELDQKQSAEELIEEVEAELAARRGLPAVPEAPAVPE